MKKATFVLAALLCAASAGAQQLQTVGTETNRATSTALGASPECGVSDLDNQTARWIDDMVRRVPQAQRKLEADEEIQIPVVFHAIAAGKKGKLLDDQILTVIHNLNVAYSGTPFSFVLIKINRVNNKSWYESCGPTTKNEKAMKKRLAVDPRHVLNIYSCKTALPQVPGLVGYAYFPFMFPENSYMHGVVVHPLTLPGSGHPDVGVYGLTTAHEVGHYLGLYHTFQDGCANGDQVGDTPAQAGPTQTCSLGIDTCAGGGADDVPNFMNYVPDTCMDHFTPQQVERMIAQALFFRPGLF